MLVSELESVGAFGEEVEEPEPHILLLSQGLTFWKARFDLTRYEIAFGACLTNIPC